MRWNLAVQRRGVPSQWVAWLGILAMTLIVVMPVLSRVMPMTGAMPGMDAFCVHHTLARTKHPSPSPTPEDPTARCGYCLLLHHTPPLATDEVIHFVPALLDIAEPLVFRPQSKHALPWLSADPRGPPAVV